MKKIFHEFVSQFEMLTPEEVNLIVDNSDIKTFKKGTILLSEGQVANKCYFVLKGCVSEYYLVNGMEKITSFYTEFQPVNSFTSNSTKAASKHYLACIEECILTEGNNDLVSAMCALVPRLESILLQEVEKGAGKAQDEHAAFVTSTPEERYLNLLENRPQLLNRVPQYQIASYLGITPESLSRIRKRIVVQK